MGGRAGVAERGRGAAAAGTAPSLPGPVRVAGSAEVPRAAPGSPVVVWAIGVGLLALVLALVVVADDAPYDAQVHQVLRADAELVRRGLHLLRGRLRIAAASSGAITEK